MAYGAILGQTPDLSSYATKNDLNDYLPLNGGTMNGSINMGNQRITNIANGINNNDVVTKQYVDNLLSSSMSIEVQTYVGSDDSGSSHQRSITFSNKPIFVIVYPSKFLGSSSDGYNCNGAFFNCQKLNTTNTQYGYSIIAGNNLFQQAGRTVMNQSCIASLNGNTLKWFYDGSGSSVTTDYALNFANVEYTVVGFCQ